MDKVHYTRNNITLTQINYHGRTRWKILGGHPIISHYCNNKIIFQFTADANFLAGKFFAIEHFLYKSQRYLTDCIILGISTHFILLYTLLTSHYKKRKPILVTDIYFYFFLVAIRATLNCIHRRVFSIR